MSRWRSKVVAVALCVACGELLVPGCDQLGLDGTGGAGGADPLGGTPCQNGCYADYDAAANKCAKIASDTDRKACQDSADAALKQCLNACAGKACEDMFADCEALGGGCTKGFPGCSTFGLSPCGACLKACKADVSYPKACRCLSCGFE